MNASRAAEFILTDKLTITRGACVRRPDCA